MHHFLALMVCGFTFLAAGFVGAAPEPSPEAFCGDKKSKEFQSDAGRFKVFFPGEPKSTTTKGQGGVDVTVYTFETENWSYTINHYDAPFALPKDPVEVQPLLSAEVSGLYKGLKGTWASQKFVPLQKNYHGIDHAGTVTIPKDFNMRGRSYVVGDRIYNVVVLGDAKFVNAEAASKFLDSFQVTK